MMKTIAGALILVCSLMSNTAALAEINMSEWTKTGNPYIDAHLQYTYMPTFEQMAGDSIAGDLLNMINPFIGIIMDGYNLINLNFDDAYMALLVDLILNEGTLNYIYDSANEASVEVADKILSCIEQAAKDSLTDDDTLSLVLNRIDEMEALGETRYLSAAETGYLDSLFSIVDQADKEKFIKYFCDDLEQLGKWTKGLDIAFEATQQITNIIQLSQAYSIYQNMSSSYKTVLADDLLAAQRGGNQELAVAIEKFQSNQTSQFSASSFANAFQDSQGDILKAVFSVFFDDIIETCVVAAQATGMTIPFVTTTATGTGTVAAGMGTVIGGVYLGIELGTLACDSLFNTQDLAAGYKLLKAAESFERINSQTLKQIAEDLRNNPTKPNAQKLHEAFNLQKTTLLYSYNIFETWMNALDGQVIQIIHRDYQSAIDNIRYVKELIESCNCCKYIPISQMMMEIESKENNEVSNDESSSTASTPITPVSSTVTPQPTVNKAPKSPLNSTVDSVFIGTYDLLNDSISGAAPIEWYVLEATDDSYTLLSRYAVAERRIHATPETSWESTELSCWLNNEFFEEAFSDQEKEMIVKQYDGYVSLLKENDNRSVNPVIKNNPEIMLLEQTHDFQQKKWWLKLYPDLWLGLGDDKTRIRPAYDAKLFGDLYGGGMGYYEAATYYAIEEDSTAGNGYSVLEYGYPLNEPLAVRPVIVVNRDYVLPQMGISVPDAQSSDVVIVDGIINAMKAPEANVFDTLRPILGDLSSVPCHYRKNGETNELQESADFQFTENFLWGKHQVTGFSVNVRRYKIEYMQDLFCQIILSVADNSPENNYTVSKAYGDNFEYYNYCSDWTYDSRNAYPYKNEKLSAGMDFRRETSEYADQNKNRIVFVLRFSMPEIDFDAFFRPATSEQNPPPPQDNERRAEVEASSVIKLAEHFIGMQEEIKASKEDSAGSVVIPPTEDNPGINWKYEISDQGAVIVGFEGRIEGDIVIPDHLDGYTVTGLRSGLFSQCENLRSITIPGSVVYIGEFAFSNCESLETVTLSDGLICIDDYAFYECCELHEIEIPDSVASIGLGAFSYSGLRKIKLSSSLKVIRRDCFENSGLRSIVIPDGVETIEEWAFCNCWDIESVSIPDSVTKIGYQTFIYCTELKEINLPPYINEIAPSAFGCTGIEEIVIPDGVRAIRQGAFEGSMLKQITIPPSVTEFEANAFPQGLQTIIGEKGSAAQELAESLGVAFQEKAYVSADEAEIIKHEQVMNRRRMLMPVAESQNTNVPLLKADDILQYAGYGYNGDNADACRIVGIAPDALADIEIPNHLDENRVIKIEYSAFEACDLIRNVIVPEGVTAFGYNAFRECSRLEHVSMPESLTSIGSGAFEHCARFKEAIIPDAVSVIGEAAFNGCLSLERVKLPQNLKTIESELFQLCENLESIDIPDGVVSIKEWAFYHCEKLKTLNLPDGLIDIGDYAFSHCSSLEELVIPKSVKEISPCAFKESGIRRIIVEEGMEVFDARAILSTEGIDELRIPGSVTKINGGGFYTQGNIKRIVGTRGTAAYSLATDLSIEFVDMEEDAQGYSKTKEPSISEIPEGFVLVDKSGLRYEVEEKVGMPETRFSRILGAKSKLAGNVAFPQNEGAVIVKEIGSWAFYNAAGITGIAIPEGVEKVGSHAFYKCTGIEKIVLPSSLKYIDNYAFCDCKHLTSITIPQSVEYIGTWAFGHCYKLKTILGVPGTAAEELAKELQIEFQTIE